MRLPVFVGVHRSQVVTVALPPPMRVLRVAHGIALHARHVGAVDALRFKAAVMNARLMAETLKIAVDHVSPLPAPLLDLRLAVELPHLCTEAVLRDFTQGGIAGNSFIPFQEG
jgi:hypothetical protein